ncbi:MAG TPA: flagellin [Sphingomonadaceae bacterium]|nr:flagellin [Sphingomonadaceae bacterium]
MSEHYRGDVTSIARLAKAQIPSQTSSAMLAPVNQSQQNVMALLRKFMSYTHIYTEMD